jgi:glutamate/tyrosine decarboxylase-like PLP-dependent enzyme
LFESINAQRTQSTNSQNNPWTPFTSQDEWDLVQWIVEHRLSQRAIDEYLKLHIVCNLILKIYTNLLTLYYGTMY